MAKAVEFLKAHRMFKGTDALEIAELSRGGETRVYEAGQSIFLKNDPGNGIYGVLSGEVEISTTSEAGKEVVVARLGQGEIFGEIATFDDKGRSANASAKKTSTVFFLSRSHFLAFATRNPQILLRMIEVLCERLRRTTFSLEDSAFLDVAARVAKRISADLPAAEAEDAMAVIKMTQAALAREVGASREIVSRYLQTWRKENLIVLGRNVITVPSVRRFRNAFRDN